MISIQNVSKTYVVSKELKVPAVHNVSLEVGQGEFVVITGRSGSGKTTLLNLVAGLTRPTSGKVLLDGIEVWSLPDKEQSLLRNQRIGFVFQFASLLPTLTSLENVMLPPMFGESQDKEYVKERAAHLLEQVGLSDKLESYPRQLSGGQQQRVVIARALMNEPELLLADEPTSDLDEVTEHEIMDLFRSIHAETGVTVLLVTHSAELGRYGTRSIQMAGGEIVPSATPPG
ncbi:MAG: ABC transporter ATP-binding protein [Anaerolineae bacterium]|jgi:putative ABC transport system ATP-binding protein/lipoprotein-releasing system ATP-binding protein